MHRALSFFASAALTLLLAGPAMAQDGPASKPAAAKEKTFDSPQAVFDEGNKLVKANKTEQFITLFACRDRSYFAFQIYFAAGFMAAFAGPDAKAEIEKLAKEHKLKDMGDRKPDLNDREGMRKYAAAMFAGVDLFKFSKAMFDFLDKHADEGQGPDMEKGFAGELKDLKIDGDKATGMGPDGKPIAFLKVDGSWWLSTDRPKGKKK